MSTPPILPSALSGTTPPLTGASAGTGAGGATSIPPGILALPNGTFVRGQIVHTEPSGLATLRTPKGDMTLKTDFMLSRGSEVVIRLDTSAQGLKAKIISVDGLSAREFEANPANLQRATAPVDDLLDLPTGNTASSTARSATLPVTRVTTSSPLPPSESLPDAVIMDIPDSLVPLPTTPMRAVLLSRAPELPQLLAMLPPSVAIPKERLEAGATLKVTVSSLQSSVVSSQPSISSLQSPVSSEQIQLPQTTPAPNPLTTSPSPTTPLQSTKQEAQSTASPSPAPSPLTTTTPSTSPLPASPSHGTLPSNATLTPGPALQMLEEMVTVATSQSPVASGQWSIGSQENLTPTLAPSPSPTNPLKSAPAQTTTTPSALTTHSLPTSPSSTSPSQGTKQEAQGAASPSLAPSPLTTSPLPASPSQSTPLLTTHHAPLSQGILPAQVIGTEQSGETVLKTPMGVIKLDLVSHTGQKIALPPDTQIQLQLLSLEAAPNENTLPLKERLIIPATVAELSGQWEGLEEAMTILQQTNPAIAQQVMQQHIPQPGPKLARDILFFLLALKTDDTEQWIGKKTLEALEQSSRSDIVRKFSSELGTIRQLFTNPPSPDWQAAFIPIHHQGEWQQIRLYVKRDREKEEGQQQNKDTGSTRFIMEVDLSRMGSLQFDGFVKKQPKNTQFDLIIRSAQPLRSEDQHAIRSIYADAAGITGFKGGLSFQTCHPFPLQPLEEMIKSDRSTMA